MTTTVKLPPELEQSLRQHCAAEGRSISDVMREIEDHYAEEQAETFARARNVGNDD